MIIIQVLFIKNMTPNDNALLKLSEIASPYLTFLVFALVSPYMEELLFRGYFMGYLFKQNPLIGGILSSSIFSLLHKPETIITFSVYFIGSMALSMVYYKTKKIECSILLHSLNNAPGVIAMFFGIF